MILDLDDDSFDYFEVSLVKYDSFPMVERKLVIAPTKTPMALETQHEHISEKLLETCESLPA